MNNFAINLQNQINECISDNEELNPRNVRFTYNFSLLMNKWFEMQGCYTQILSFSNNAADVESIRSLMKSISQTLMNARKSVIQGYTLDTLRGSEKKVVALDSMKSVDITSCKNDLNCLHMLMQNAVNTLCSSGSNITGTETASLMQNMYLLTQNCVEDIESAMEQRDTIPAVNNTVPARSSAAELRRAYFSDFNQCDVSPGTNNTTVPRR